MTDITIKNGAIELGIFVKNDNAMVSSRCLAELFGKRHDNVIRDIKERILPHVSVNFRLLNFEESSYINSQNKKQPEYRITFDGFTIIAMGFTGQKAMEFKEMYIEAFHQMKNLITTRLISKEGYKEMTLAIKNYIGDDRFYYSREANMINMAVLGMKALDFKKVNGIKRNDLVRDNAVREILEQLDKAQRLNGQLIKAEIAFAERKKIVIANYKRIVF